MTRKKLLIIFIGVCYSLTAFSQATFEAFLGAKQVTTNSYFEVSFTLENGDGSNFQPPSFRQFQILSGPSRSMSTTIINRKISKKITYSYTLQSNKVGKFTIGSATILVDGKQLKTKPVTVQVVKGRSASEIAKDQQVFVVAVPSQDEVVVGEQLILDYKLFTTVGIESYNVILESDYQGFFASEIRRHDARTVRQAINGVTYATKILKRVALFPQKTGELVVDPLQIQIGISTEDPRSPSSFFSTRPLKRMNVQTEALKIKVNPLVGDPPRTFTGAVGKFLVSTAINRPTLTTDDAVSIKMIIKGNGDIKRVQPPEINFPDQFEVYDARVINESSQERRGMIEGEKTIEYLAVPKKAGTFQIQPEFTYYDTDSSKYVTMGRNIFSLTVRQGVNSSGPEIPTTEAENPDAPRDIRYISDQLRVFEKEKHFLGSSLFWILSIFPFLILGGVLLYRQVQVQRSNIDPIALRRKQARKQALKRLKEAEQYLKKQDSRAFYDEISKAMLGYVSDKLRIPTSELTKQSIRQQLEVLKVSEPDVDSLMKVIQTAEMALFAGMDNTKDMDATYQNATEVLTKIEESVLKNS